MKTIQIILSNRLEQSLEAYLQDHQASFTPDTVAQQALEEFFAARGYLPKPRKYLKIKPAPQGSGYTDTSINHDQVLAK